MNTISHCLSQYGCYHEAMTFQQAKGKGVIITRMGAPKRCGYCNSYEICSQKDQYFSNPDEEI